MRIASLRGAERVLMATRRGFLVCAGVLAASAAVVVRLRQEPAPRVVTAPSPEESAVGESEPAAPPPKRAAADHLPPGPVAGPRHGLELSRLLAALGTDALGTKIANGLGEFTQIVARRKQHARFDETALVRSWRADPKTAVADIRAALGRAREFPEFRAELLRVAGELPSPNADVRALAEAEVREKVVSGGGAHPDPSVRTNEKMLVTSAFELWMHEQPDRTEAVAFTLDAMGLQTDPFVRYGLMMSLLNAHPDAAGALATGLEQRGIPDPKRAFVSLRPPEN
jgi:hypothetical protein